MIFTCIHDIFSVERLWIAFGCSNAWKFMVQILEEESFHHLLTIGEYPLYILPVDEDVLSFELDLAYKV